MEETARRSAVGERSADLITGEKKSAGDSIAGVLDERAALRVVTKPVPEVIVFVGIDEVMTDFVCNCEVLTTRPWGCGVKDYAFFSEGQPVAPAVGTTSLSEGGCLTKAEAEAAGRCLLRVAT